MYRRQEGLAIVSGPGSFTGLRIGLAAIKALGEVLAKPIVALSMLEIVARAGLTGGRCLAAMDAGRNEVYVGNFDGQTLGTERLLTMSEFLLLAQDIPVVTADSNIANAARSASLVFEEIARPRADSVARLGWGKIQARELVSPEELEANYIRRADAEIFSAPK